MIHLSHCFCWRCDKCDKPAGYYSRARACVRESHGVCLSHLSQAFGRVLPMGWPPRGTQTPAYGSLKGI